MSCPNLRVESWHKAGMDKARRGAFYSLAGMSGKEAGSFRSKFVN